MFELVSDLCELNRCQHARVLVVIMDDVNTMEGPLREAFPDAEPKMDVGHVIFSRLGKLLSKSHGNYREYHAILTDLLVVVLFSVLSTLR